MMRHLIQKERICQLFRTLAELDSISFQERAAADYVKNILQELEADVYEDEAWKQYARSEAEAEAAGNVYAFIPGSVPGKPLLFSAHLDTVAPGLGKKAVQAEDRFTSDGTTVLGSDDMAGVAQILEAVRLLKEHEIPHRSLELVFPFAEEVYGMGSQVMDYDRLQAEEAYVLDLSGPVGQAAIQAPSIISFRVNVKGRSAHAGFAPEKGIHAIKAASEALTYLTLGRIGADATRNVGIIQGGAGRNIVPELVTVEGEIRSYSHQKAMQLTDETIKVFSDAAAEYGANIEFTSKVHIKAYKTEEASPVVQRFLRACEALELSGGLESTFGGSDNNSFAEHGIKGIVLSCGMEQVHTKDEYIMLDDLYEGTALVMQLMTEA